MIEMRGRTLRQARQERGWTQEELAQRLEVSQGYVSLLENDRRRVPEPLLSKLRNLLPLPPTELPAEEEPARPEPRKLAQFLAGLGYPGFAYVRPAEPLNPAQLVLTALRQPDLEARFVEALPWVVARYPELDWEWLVPRAKVHDLQNRLGFVVAVAREVAERLGEEAAGSKLAEVERSLQDARLAREDTLCHESMTEAERDWVREHRPLMSQQWNLLTDLSPDHLSYAA